MTHAPSNAGRRLRRLGLRGHGPAGRRSAAWASPVRPFHPPELRAPGHGHPVMAANAMSAVAHAARRTGREAKEQEVSNG